MQTVLMIVVGVVAVEHLYFLYLEMFMWTTDKGRKVFGTTIEEAATTKTLAANQGLYNGFLAAGLIWSLVHPNAVIAAQIQLFFLGCIIVAAVYGGMTAKRSILYIQGIPALIGLVLLFF